MISKLRCIDNDWFKIRHTVRQVYCKNLIIHIKIIRSIGSQVKTEKEHVIASTQLIDTIPNPLFSLTIHNGNQSKKTQ